MWLPAFVSKIANNKLTIIIQESLNIEHLKTMYEDDLSKIYARIEIVDPRKARPAQRKLFFALLNDIQTWSGAPMKDFLKDYFYTIYSIENDGAEISLADNTKNSVSDANKLLDIVVDFVFDWNVPIKESYELLPRSESWFLFQCCKHRQCFECGKYADIHHIETIGMGGNRLKVDHTKRHVMALCRQHHQELEQIGPTKFSAKYRLPVNGIRLDVETLKKIGVKGDYREEEENER